MENQQPSAPTQPVQSTQVPQQAQPVVQPQPTIGSVVNPETEPKQSFFQILKNAFRKNPFAPKANQEPPTPTE